MRCCWKEEVVWCEGIVPVFIDAVFFIFFFGDSVGRHRLVLKSVQFCIKAGEHIGVRGPFLSEVEVLPDLVGVVVCFFPVGYMCYTVDHP